MTYNERRDTRFNAATVVALKDIQVRALQLPQEERYAAAYGILRGYTENLLTNFAEKDEALAEKAQGIETLQGEIARLHRIIDDEPWVDDLMKLPNKILSPMHKCALWAYRKAWPDLSKNDFGLGETHARELAPLMGETLITSSRRLRVPRNLASSRNQSPTRKNCLTRSPANRFWMSEPASRSIPASFLRPQLIGGTISPPCATMFNLNSCEFTAGRARKRKYPRAQPAGCQQTKDMLRSIAQITIPGR
jgi:hypothetical protein